MHSNNTIGLYIHIPFCKTKCLYCNFYSMVGEFNQDIQEIYLNSIIKELKLRKNTLTNKIIDTIYIGGGSPSYISCKLYKTFFNILFNMINSDDVKEFTIELNPNDVSIDLIKLLKTIKNIRLSLGVQSLDDNILKIIRRDISIKKIFNALDIISENSIDKLSLDFISSLPLGNIDSSKNSIETLLKQYKNINHVSLYYLELDERVHLKNKWKGMLPNEDNEIEEYKRACDILKYYGFERYEISSFASSVSSQSKHNIHYWSLDDYLALGCGAYGCIDDERYKNNTNINEYIEDIANNKLSIANIEKLSIDEREKEFIFLSFRQKQGINIDKYTQLFDSIFIEKYKNILNQNLNCFNITNCNISIKEELINFTDEISILFF